MKQTEMTVVRARGVRRKRGQRGSIAVEFALVLPMFLCALGLIMNVGLSFYARFQLSNYASAAARYCVSQVNVNQSQLSGCVQSYMNGLDLSHIEGLCGGAPNALASVQSGPGANNYMKVLDVKVSCSVLWSSFANVVNNDGRTAWTITVDSSMPFTAINY